MTPQAKKKLIGAVVAAALAIAVYYGLIDQKQANNIKTQADQALGTGPNGQQQPQQAPPQQAQPQQPQQPTAPQPASTGSTAPAPPTPQAQPAPTTPAAPAAPAQQTGTPQQQ